MILIVAQSSFVIVAVRVLYCSKNEMAIEYSSLSGLFSVANA
jgi:hypothetical protein